MDRSERENDNRSENAAQKSPPPLVRIKLKLSLTESQPRMRVFVNELIGGDGTISRRKRLNNALAAFDRRGDGRFHRDPIDGGPNQCGKRQHQIKGDLAL